jgi:carboxynorspermidine decarboxylase
MFNGIRHPAICAFEPENNEVTVLREFNYADFRDRMC